MYKKQIDYTSLHTSKEEFLVVLDSRNATTYLNDSKNSSIMFQFEDSIQKDKNAIKLTCSVMSFTCPVSFYNINSTNNLFSVTISSPSPVNYDFYVPPGNYNVNTLITALSSIPLTITFNNLSNKLTLTHSTYNFTINSKSTIYGVMGFKNQTTYTSSSLSVTLPYTVNFAGLNSFNIHFDNIVTRNIDSFTLTNSSIIASIPVNANQAGVIFFNKSFDFEFLVSQNVIDFIQIDLKDDIGTYLDLNNSHWNLTLQFTSYMDKPRKETTFLDITGNNYNT